MDCIFCQIASGKIPTDLLYQDEDIVAFRDINPKAPVHVLIVPRRHVVSTEELNDNDTALAGKMILAGRQLARSERVASSGYRLLFNCGPDSGQEVPHLHLHLLGGRKMGIMG